MMNIVESKRTYNLAPILKESIEISEFNFARSWDRGFGGLQISENIVTFGFGRQCGHTTAIRDLLLSDARLNRKTNVVTPNHNMSREEYLKHGIINSTSVHCVHETMLKLFVGRCDYGIIFDACTPSDIAKFFMQLAPYLQGKDNLKFVVNVAPVL